MFNKLNRCIRSTSYLLNVLFIGATVVALIAIQQHTLTYRVSFGTDAATTALSMSSIEAETASRLADLPPAPAHKPSAPKKG
jgi:hypothetical protein